MLPSIKNDLMYLLNILESIEKILLYSKDCSDAEEFYMMNDQLYCLNWSGSLTLIWLVSPALDKSFADSLKDFLSPNSIKRFLMKI